jgi:hypothetical protein
MGRPRRAGTGLDAALIQESEFRIQDSGVHYGEKTASKVKLASWEYPKRRIVGIRNRRQGGEMRR